MFEYKNCPPLLCIQDISHVGGTIWDSEVILSHFLDEFIVLLMGNEINLSLIEMGCGSGLAGIVGSLIKRRRRNEEEEELILFDQVVLCDVGEVIHDITLKNKEFVFSRLFVDEEEKQNDNLELKELDWKRSKEEDEMKEENNELSSFNVVLLSDCLYHEEDFEDIFHCITILLKKKRGIGIITFEIRNEQTSNKFYSFFDLFINYCYNEEGGEGEEERRRFDVFDLSYEEENENEISNLLFGSNLQNDFIEKLSENWGEENEMVENFQEIISKMYEFGIKGWNQSHVKLIIVFSN